MTTAELDHLTGLLRDCLTEPWRAAFAATPRELFIPDQALWVHDGDVQTPIDRASDPQMWRSAVYSNESIVTQFDDGTAGGDGDATSSSSMPLVMALMLHQLDARPGHAVLEIGTGTGYNAALLAHRVGPRNVTTIEVDPVIARQARVNLAAADRPVTVITGDGAYGHPPGAPY
ncbi:MAG: rRNA adenine N-6-methyltransferase family protein, partial [Pseudonocardiaceae bacterium]